MAFDPFRDAGAIELKQEVRSPSKSFDPFKDGGAIEINPATGGPYPQGYDEEADIGPVESGVSSTVRGFARGMASLPKSVATMAKATDPFGEYEGKEAKDLVTYKAGQAIEDVANEMFPVNPKHSESMVAGKIPEGIGQMGSFIFGGLAKQGMKIPLLMGISAEASGAYDEAKSHGATEDQALKAAAYTAPVGALDSIVPGHLLKRLYAGAGGNLTHKLLDTIFSSGLEAGTEGAQTVLENAVAKKIYDADRSYWDGAVESSEVGGVVGLIADLVVKGATGMKGRGNVSSDTEAPVVSKTEKAEPTTAPQAFTVEELEGNAEVPVKTGDDLSTLTTLTTKGDDAALSGLEQEAERQFGRREVRTIDPKQRPLPDYNEALTRLDDDAHNEDDLAAISNGAEVVAKVKAEQILTDLAMDPTDAQKLLDWAGTEGKKGINVGKLVYGFRKWRQGKPDLNERMMARDDVAVEDPRETVQRRVEDLAQDDELGSLTQKDGDSDLDSLEQEAEREHGQIRYMKRDKWEDAKPGDTLLDLAKVMPSIEPRNPMIPIGRSNEEIASHAADVFKAFPDSVKASDGSTIKIWNKERDSIGARLWHLMRDGTTNTIDVEKARFLPLVTQTIEEGKIRSTNPKSGNKVYVAKYGADSFHAVVVSHDGVIIDQGLLNGKLVTQFPFKPKNNPIGLYGADWVAGMGDSDQTPPRRSYTQTEISPRVTTFQDQYTTSIEEVNGVLRDNGIASKVELVDSGSVPVEYRSKITDDVAGFYDPKTDRVFVLSDRVRSKSDLQRIVLHEVVGHRGIRGVLGNGMNEVLALVLESKDAGGQMKVIADQYDLDLSKQGDRNIAAEEYLARLAEGNVKDVSLWDRIVSKINSLLRKIGFSVSLSGSEIRNLLVKARRHDSSLQSGSDGVRFSRDPQPSPSSVTESRSVMSEKVPSFAFRMLRGFGPFESAVDTLRKAGGRLKDAGERIAKYFDDEAAIKAEVRRPFDDILRPLSKKDAQEALSQVEKYLKAKESAKAYDQLARTGFGDPDFHRQRADESRAEAQRLKDGLNPTAQRLMAEIDRMFERMNEVNQSLGVKVFDPMQKTFRAIGKVMDYWPRQMRREIAEILEAGGDANPAKYQALLAEMAQFGGVDQERAQQFLRDYKEMVSTNGFFGNIEAARVGNLPPGWFEYSLERVLPSYTDRWARRISQIKHFGQRIGKGSVQKDIFDKLIGDSNSNRTRSFLGAVQNRIYEVEPNTRWYRFMRGARAYTTVAKLSNPMSAIRNLSTVFTNTLPEFGVMPALKAMWNIRDNVLKAEEAGVLRSDLIAGMAEAREYTEKQAKMIGKGLKWSGFSGVELFNRGHAVGSGLSWARWAIKKIKADMDSRTSIIARAKFEKYGLDWRKLDEEFSRGEWGLESKKLARAAANATQFTYDMRQVPQWMEDPLAKFFFQFQKFGLSMTRRVLEDVVKPAVVGHVVDGRRVRDIRPALTMMAMATLGGEGLLLLRELLFGMERPDASLDEILNTMKEDELSGLGMLLSRFWNDILYAGGVGIVGDWGTAYLADPAKSLRKKTPLEPPSFGTVRNVLDNLYIRYTEQGRITAQDWKRFLLRELPGVNYTARGVLNASRLAGANWDAAELQERQNVLYTARSARDRFFKETGVERPAFAGAFGRTERSPMYDRMTEALMLGDAAQAKSVMKELLATAKTGEERKKLLRALKSSVSARGPLSMETNQRRPFLKWLQKRDPDLYKRFQDLNRNYYKTAGKLGLVSLGVD